MGKPYAGQTTYGQDYPALHLRVAPASKVAGSAMFCRERHIDYKA